MSRQQKFILDENQIPEQWYNIQADMVNKPLPPLNPAEIKKYLKSGDVISGAEIIQKDSVTAR